MESRINTSRSPIFFILAILSTSLLPIVTLFCTFQIAHAQDVIFIAPGSSDPASVLRFDPPLQIIEEGQSIVFVNPDGLDHHLVVKSEGGSEEFDTGVLSMNKFVSHTFSDNGEYTFECKIYPHMKGEIKVTDDIATFSRTIESQNLDVQLTQSPASPGVNEEVFYKLTFIDMETGRNHPHVDFTLTFHDSSDTYVDGIGGHTVDGQDSAVFKFDKEDAFTPAVTVSGVEFIPISPETVRFDTVVTPEFPLIGVGAVLASALGAIALYMRKKFSIDDHS